MRPAPARAITLDEKRPIWQLLLVFLVPLMLSNVLQSLSSTVSSIYIGRMVGVDALAAVSAIFPVLFLLLSFMIGIASGSTVLIGQAYGAQDSHKVKQVAGTTLAMTVILSLLVAVFGALFSEDLLRLMGTPANILAISASYSRVVFLSMPVLFVYIIYTTFLRGTGDARTPFITLIAGTILTLAFTPVFIKGWFGMPAMGTNGAAIGSLLANFLATAGLLVYLSRTGNPLAVDGELLSDIRLRWNLVRTIVRIGVPTGINIIMVSLSEIAVISFVNHFGSNATAAYGAVNQVVSYVQFPAISIGIAASIFGSQAIGANRLERIPSIVRSAVIVNYVIEGVLIDIGYLFSWHLVSLFITDPDTVAIAQRLLHITLWSYAIFGNARVLANIMLSSGTVIWPTLISIFSIWAVEVPVAYVLMQRIGLDGVWYGYPAAYVAGLILQLLYYKLVWKKRPLTRLV